MSFFRRIAATLNSNFRRPPLTDTPSIQLESYAERLRREIELFGAIERVHDLPEIFHFWSNRYVRPKLESVLGVSNIDDFFIKYIREFCTAHPGKEIRIVSIGAGNSDTEIRIAQKLRDQGLRSFRFRCLDINPSMLERGRQLASDVGLREKFEFVESDIADWREDEPVPVVMAVHSLHHIVSLERIFERIKEAIGK